MLPCAGGLGDLWDAIATEQVGFGHEVPRVPWQGECLKGKAWQEALKAPEADAWWGSGIPR